MDLNKELDVINQCSPPGEELKGGERGSYWVMIYMVYFSGLDGIVVQLLLLNRSLANSLCSLACFEEE